MRQRHVTRQVSVAVAAFVIHGVLLLVAMRVRTPPREAPALPQFVSLWLTERVPNSTAQAPGAAALSTSGRSDEQSDPAAVGADEETKAASPEVEPGEAPAAIDWMREGSLVARSVGEALQTGRSEAFSPRVPKIREPCLPKETSFKWNPEEKRVGLAGGLPFVRLGNCVVGLGFFGCSGKPQPNTHLFDDIVESNRQESSVPDPDDCD